MAIFEKTSQSKVIIDDTDILECTLENAQNVNKHTEYVLRVQRGNNEHKKWIVSRRYSDFAALHVSLQQANIDLPIPPKKLIGNMQPSFVAERQIALQNYINEILKHQILAMSLPVRTFLDPKNYSLNISDQALQTMSIALRGDGQYELKGLAADIGWRIRKKYFLVNETENKTNCLLTWQSYGPDKHLESKDLQTALKCLQNISHPHIDEILQMHTLESGVYVVRRIHQSGSLRDLLYGTEWNKNYLAKYGNPKIRKPLTSGQLAHYGYQILHALKFLHDKGITHGHIHPGNIAIEDQRALLMDMENALIGVPCVHRPHLLQAKGVRTAEAVDVYCFGRTLYELAFAAPLQTYYCNTYPEGITDNLESVLRLCVSGAACKHGPASLGDLLHHPLFTGCGLNGLTPDARAHLKFPLALKHQLRLALDAAEERLLNDQNLVRNAKREVRIQEILSSEQEMKKQKKRARKRDGVWRSSSSLGEPRSRSASTASSPTPPAPALTPAPAPGPAPVPRLGVTNGGAQKENAFANADSGGGGVGRGGSVGSGAGVGDRGSVGGGECVGGGRSALLQDICNFDRAKLAARAPR